MPPRTKSELIEHLNARGLRLRRRDGQNFLVEPRLADAIVADAGVRATDSVIEIGPGAGALTIPLLHRAGRVLSVELDQGLVALLRDDFGPDPRLNLVHGDCLDGPDGLHRSILDEIAVARGDGFERVLVVANLPYSVGTEVVIRLLSLDRPPDAITVMLQAEVVDRLVAKPRSDAYGPLAVLVALTSDVRVLRRIGPRAFFPQPDVDSVVVRIEPSAAKRAAGDVRAATDLARKAFQHRRKKLVKAFEGVVTEEVIVRAGIDPGARPETVDPAGWIRLAAAASV